MGSLDRAPAIKPSVVPLLLLVETELWYKTDGTCAWVKSFIGSLLSPPAYLGWLPPAMTSVRRSMQNVRFRMRACDVQIDMRCVEARKMQDCLSKILGRIEVTLKSNLAGSTF
jgi:hypothetical protein